MYSKDDYINDTIQEIITLILTFHVKVFYFQFVIFYVVIFFCQFFKFFFTFFFFFPENETYSGGEGGRHSTSPAQSHYADIWMMKMQKINYF
jgi:hypothetical protein